MVTDPKMCVAAGLDCVVSVDLCAGWFRGGGCGGADWCAVCGECTLIRRVCGFGEGEGVR